MDQGYVPSAAAQVASDSGITATDVDDPAPGLFLQVRDSGSRAAQSADIFCVEIAKQRILV